MLTYQTIPSRLFDTTVFIDHLNNFPEATQLIEDAFRSIHPAAFSILTEAELWTGVHDKDDQRIRRMMLSRLHRLSMTVAIARQAGHLRRLYNPRSIKLPDAIIAATAEIYSLPLYTANPRDFTFITSIQVITYRS